MTDSAALVGIGVPHKLAEGSGAPPALFLKEARVAGARLGFLHGEYPRSSHAAGLLQRVLQVFGTLRGGRRSRSGICEAGPCRGLKSLRKGFAKPTSNNTRPRSACSSTWLVVGQIIGANPAHAVRGPMHIVTKGRTPVLNRKEARPALLHRYKHPHRPARPGLYRRDDLDLRPRRRGPADKCRGLLHARQARLDTPARKARQGQAAVAHDGTIHRQRPTA